MIPALLVLAIIPVSGKSPDEGSARRPNILICMADDWGWPHAGAYGEDWIKTPGFDRIAEEGVLFQNAFTNSPSCTASRGGLLTGRYPWKLEEGGVLWGAIPARYPTYTDVLAAAGYKIGFTGKGHGPAKNSNATGRSGGNPAGPEYNKKTIKPPAGAMGKYDYAANFEDFLAARDRAQPFCFWYGSKEPHRKYKKDVGRTVGGGDPADVKVPGFFPDNATIRNDMLDYGFEIEYSDSHLVRMIEKLESLGELDNTIIIVTGDHGMPFPRCKANLYEWGIHVPFAVRWGDRVPRGRKVTDIVSFIDVAPTLLDAAGIEAPDEMLMHGKSLLKVLESTSEGQVDPARNVALLGTDRHSPNDANEAATGKPGAGYPIRALRTPKFLYIRNYEPGWTPNGGDGGPTKSYIEAHPEETPAAGLGMTKTYHELSFGPREAEELYYIATDPECLVNLATEAAHQSTLGALRDRMNASLKEHMDPRVLGFGNIFFGYPYQKRSLKYFQPWLAEARISLLADDDGDGASNAHELLFLSDPRDPSSTAYPATIEGGGPAGDTLRYAFTPEIPEVEAVVEWRFKQGDWQSDETKLSVLERKPASQINEVRVKSGGGDSQLLFKLSTNLNLRNDD